MPRKPRIEFPGAVYHVMSRGDHGEAIFRDDQDRIRLLETLGEACEKTGWRVHAYVLMSNHYHLLVETPGANLVMGMKWFQGTFTQRFNSRHRLRGHLLQGRYQALVVESEGEYFETVSTYIHLNPVRAKLVRLGAGQKLRSYRWSSYPAYVTGSRPSWLEVERVLRETGAGGNNRTGRRRYEAYVESRALEVEQQGRPAEELEEEWRRIRRGWYLGSESFRDRLLEGLGQVLHGKRKESLGGEGVRERLGQDAEEELHWAMSVLGWQEGELVDGAKGSERKQVLAWWLRKRTVVGRAWIAERLRMGHLTRVTWAVDKVRKATGGEVARWRNRLDKQADR